MGGLRGYLSTIYVVVFLTRVFHTINTIIAVVLINTAINNNDLDSVPILRL